MKQLHLFATSNKLGNKKQILSHGVVLGICLVFAWHVGLLEVRAQSPEATPVSEATDSAVPVTPYDDQLAELAKSYRGQLEEYRSKEQGYTIARADFLQLQTLASLENLLVAIREATVIRDQVLVTYLQQLRITLVATPGIEVDAKERTLEKLETLIEVIELHQQVATNAQDRAQVQELVNAFTIIEPEFQTIVYFSRSLIEYGQLRAVTDTTRALYEDLQEEDISTLTPSERNRRQRNLQEIANEFDLADTQFSAMYALMIKEEAVADDGTYRDVKTGLNQVYAQITKIQNFLDEII